MEEFSSDEKDRLQACVSVVEAELRSAGSLDRTWSSRDRRHGGSGQQEWGGCRGVGVWELVDMQGTGCSCTVHDFTRSYLAARAEDSGLLVSVKVRASEGKGR